MADYRISDLVEKVQRGEMTRRDLVKRGALLGLSATALASLAGPAAFAAPGTKRSLSVGNQIDASTLVVADNLSGGTWLTLDPAWFYEISSSVGMYLIYESLYHIPDSLNPTDVQPLLADGMPTFSDDGLTVTVKLRPGVKFHTTGTEAKAADWIFSFNRLKNIGYQGSFLAVDYWTEVVAVDDLTLQFTLAAPNAALAAVLTAMPLGVTEAAAVVAAGGTDAAPSAEENAPEVEANKAAKDIIDGASVGTGPYKVTQWDVNSEVILEAHADYWGEAPAFERVIFRNVVDVNAQLQEVQTGNADIAYSLNKDSVQSVKDDANLQLLEGPTLALQYIGMNLVEEKGGPLAKKEVRQAIAYSIDYDGIRDGILLGAGTRPATIVPLPLTGSEEVLELAYKQDLAKAQELFDTAGVGEVEISVTYDSDAPGQGGVNLETLATKLKADVEQIKGLKFNLQPMPGTERITAYRAGDFQATISPWTPDYPDVDTYATPFARTGVAAAKRVGFSNPDVDALLDQGLAELDPVKRTEIYVSIQKTLIDECPYIVLYQPVDQKAALKTLQGASIHSVYQINLRNASKTE